MKTGLFKRMAAEQATVNKVDGEMVSYILENLNFETESDSDIGIKVEGILPLATITAKFGELNDQELNQLTKMLSTNSDVIGEMKEVANDAKDSGINSFEMPQLHVEFDKDKITIVADIDTFTTSDMEQQDTNMENGEDYHNQKDFI